MKKNLYFIAFVLITFTLGEIITKIMGIDKNFSQSQITELNANLAQIQLLFNNNFIVSLFFFTILFLLFQIFFIPFAGSIFSILFGYFYGFQNGSLIFSFVGPIGYTTAFLVAKFLFNKIIHTKENKKINYIVNEFNNDGLSYFFSLRLSGVIPASFLNFSMGATNIKTYQFFLITYFGILPYVFIYCYIGNYIRKSENIFDLITIKTSIILVLASLIPVLFKILIELKKKIF